ncbi:MAG: hypothetical protein WC838_02725 [Candidatus Margulisiibacteriota bacterium]
MKAITIPKNITGGIPLVIITQEQYKEYIQLRRIKEFTPEAQDKKALKSGRENLKKGRSLSYGQFSKALGA